MKKNKLVNWHGEMELTSDHFVQTENYFIGEITDTRSIFLSKNEYGLLPLSDVDKQVGIQIREHISNHVEVTLYSCNAITASGLRIEFNPSISESALTKIYSADDDQNARGKNTLHWDIILSVDPYARVAVGELDPREDPPRHPDAESLYKLHIVPSDEVNISTFGSHFLTIGKMRKEAGRYLVDANYIPPCRTMSSDAELVNYFRRFDRLFYGLRKSSHNIISKVNDRSSGNELAVNIRLMSHEMLRYLTSIHFSLRNRDTSIAPVLMSEYICTLASACYVSLISLPGVQKDELLKYFYEWSGVTPGSFEELLASTMELEYDHENLRSVMVQLESFATTLFELWDRLSHLEYIGQHKESLIVSASGGNSRTEERRVFVVTE